MKIRLIIAVSFVSAGFPVQRYLVSSMRRGGPLRTETTRANMFKRQFFSIFTIFSVCMAVVAVQFYQGLPV